MTHTLFADQDLPAQGVLARHRGTIGVVRLVVVNVLAAVFGAATWVCGSVLTGRSNVFDAPLYPLYLFGGGVCLSALLKSHGWSVAVAILGGQLIGFWRVVAGNVNAYLWPLGLGFLVACSFIALAGALVPPAYRALRAPRPRESGPPS